MQKRTRTQIVEDYFLELLKAEVEIKWYKKTSEQYKYLKKVIKNNKMTIRELFTKMTWDETYKIAKWLLNRKIETQRNIIKNEYTTTNSQRIKALNKYFELSEVARADQYVNYLDKIILDY